MNRTLTVVAALLLAGVSLRAQLIFSDPLDYPNGDITTNSGGLWIHHSGATNDSLAVNHRYEFNEARGADVLRWFDPVSTNGYLHGALYASFFLSMSNLPSDAGGTYFAHFMDTNSQYRGRIFALITNALPGTYRLGAANARADFSGANSGPSVVCAQDLLTNLDYQVVLKYDLDNAFATLWVNPATEDDPSSGGTTDLGPVTNALTAFSFRQAAGEGIGEVSKLRVGLSFADVVTGPATLPVIGLEPVGVTNYMGNPASLTVMASGRGLTYQWVQDGSPVPGATLNQYAVSQLQGSHQGFYYCTVSNTAGSTNSSTVYVSVNTTPTAPIFTLQPLDSTNTPGQTATFTTAVVGTGPLSFQWYLNNSPLGDGPTGSGSVIAGAASTTLTISGLTLSDAGTYALLATGAGSTTSSNALLVLQPPLVVMSRGNYSQNFDSLLNSGTANPWLDGGTLQGWYASQQSGSLSTYRADPGSVNNGALYSYGSVGSTDRALGSIGANSVGGFAYGVLFSNDTAQIATNITVAYTGEQWRNGGNTTAQKLTFSYRVSTSPLTNSEVANTNTLFWTRVSALDFTTPTTGSAAASLDGNQAANRTVIPGVLLAGVTVLPGSEIFLRWYDVNDAGNDHAVAVDDLSVTFTTVSPPPTPPVFTLEPVSRTNNAGTTATFIAAVSGDPSFVFQWLKDTVPLSDGLSASGSTISGASGPQLTVSSVFGGDAGDYQLSVVNNLGSSNSFIAHLTVLDPVITAQPADVTDVVGDNANLFVGAFGSPTLSFQWLSNGVPIPGATANPLNLAVDAASAQAAYSVVVANGLNNSVTSSVAHINLVATPSFKLAEWNFNSPAPDNNTATGTTTASVGAGEATLLPGNSAAFANGAFADPATAGTDNSGWNTTSYPAPGTSNKLGGAQFTLSSVGYKNLLVTWQQRNSATASKYARLQYTTNGTTFRDFTAHTMLNTNTGFEFFQSDLSGVAGVNNNANFAFRIVTEFQSTATGSGLADYVPTSPGNYSTGGTIRFDMVEVFADPASRVTPIPLGFQQINGALVLSWNDGTFALQAAPEVTGTYTNIPGAQSPYTNLLTGPRKFFRLKH